MRVLLFHGYMLRGTGSNIYNANLARALAELGHEVHLLCQDRATKIEGVEIYNPDIHGLLPVYVKDPYEGFEVKAFPELQLSTFRPISKWTTVWMNSRRLWRRSSLNRMELL